MSQFIWVSGNRNLLFNVHFRLWGCSHWLFHQYSRLANQTRRKSPWIPFFVVLLISFLNKKKKISLNVREFWNIIMDANHAFMCLNTVGIKNMTFHRYLTVFPNFFLYRTFRFVYKKLDFWMFTKSWSIIIYSNHVFMCLNTDGIKNILSSLHKLLPEFLSL